MRAETGLEREAQAKPSQEKDGEDRDKDGPEDSIRKAQAFPNRL
jgi:hypothetical protein